MAIKLKDMKEMGREELLEKLSELKKELMKLNAQVHTGTAPKNPGQIKQIKKTTARILTLLKIREMQKKKEENSKEKKEELKKA